MDLVRDVVGDPKSGVRTGAFRGIDGIGNLGLMLTKEFLRG